MPDIVMSCNIDAAVETVWRAISTTDGVTGWFTSQAEIGKKSGFFSNLLFPSTRAR